MGSLAAMGLGQAEVARVVDLSLVLVLAGCSGSSSTGTCILEAAVIWILLRRGMSSGGVELASNEWLGSDLDSSDGLASLVCSLLNVLVA